MYFFAGSYTETNSPAAVPKGLGIVSCSFDPENGSIRIIDSQFQRNPAYPIVSANGMFLYVAEEIFKSENPQLVSYRIHENGNLIMLNAVPLPGDYACHLAIASQTILVANYGSGDILVYALEEDGSIGPMMQRIKHTGSGVNKERQEAPHPHMIYPIDDHTVYCVDLGIDMAKAYRFVSSEKRWEPATEPDIKIKPGAGARHMDMDLKKEWLVLIGELSGEVFLYRKTETGFQCVDTASTGKGEMTAAAIRVHADGRFIYCSERTTNCIYTFTVSPNKLQPIGAFSSGGKTPRDIAIDPTGKWLLSANQDENMIAVFSIDQLTGELRFASECFVPTPSCICWQTQKTPAINN
ncbi:MAG TPA: lactonase family protein [Parafilimonas sp.]|nr:lactonase family protein [Parafilimonas sp.]